MIVPRVFEAQNRFFRPGNMISLTYHRDGKVRYSTAHLSGSALNPLEYRT